ncbi:hypothetical protein DHW03_03235 [Pedobacter yonginense]|uniref:Toxin-antitoxin system YwqK family antitoxin n=1 Tax=Pedobacter yonginense TaxID=651869 RepID=A0A317EPR9_9SPHI|nr:hypothetical protein [Pedobacter yonginense]PWS28861.1 hypothetical protein DHW03_03235 [Pedobacter yonginense]
MKKTSFMMFFTMLFVTQAFAQKSITSALLQSYSHTVNYSWGKAVFHLLPAEKQIEHTNLEKHYFWYSGNVLNHTQGGFSGRLLDGDYSEYYNNNNLKVQGTFKTGLKHGAWRAWTEDGILQSVTHYKFGSIDGEFMEYDVDGKILKTGFYNNGRLDGKLCKYQGDSLLIEKYNNGKIILPKVSWLERRLTGFFTMIKRIF